MHQANSACLLNTVHNTELPELHADIQLGYTPWADVGDVGVTGTGGAVVSDSAVGLLSI